MDRLPESDLSTLFPERNLPLQAGFKDSSVRGCRVLITGAGGSIGAALARRILDSSPKRLILLDRSERALHGLRRVLDRRDGADAAQFVLGDVRDDRLVETLLAEKLDVLFHAAAFKHVPLLEQNPFAAVENNGLATWRLARNAARFGVRRMLLISTDKAANPRSMLGVSKRLAELAMLRWDRAGTRMSALRLGNVAGSSGSVLPAFCEQIERGGPVTVTHPEATRYFLTMEETCAMIGALASVESASGLLVPDMGTAISILKLAQRMIGAASSERSTNITVKITGLRPGDKLTEDLLSPGESLGTEIAPGIRRICAEKISAGWMDAKILKIEEIMRRRDLVALLRALQEVVPEFQPGATLANRSATAAAGGGNG
jgi:FlaA1/EpsC-like NDP-sugar epimerase